jgi:hypothetical protein
MPQFEKGFETSSDGVILTFSGNGLAADKVVMISTKNTFSISALSKPSWVASDGRTYNLK